MATPPTESTNAPAINTRFMQSPVGRARAWLPI